MTTGYTPSQFAGNPTTTQLNAELNNIQTALDACFQRLDETQDGVPQVNQMELDLDMNGNSILNVAQGVGPGSLVTLQQVQELVNSIQTTGGTGVNPAALTQLQADLADLTTLVGPGLGGTLTESLITIGNSLGSISGTLAQQGEDIDTLSSIVSTTQVSLANTAGLLGNTVTRVEALEAAGPGTTPTPPPPAAASALLEKSFSFYGAPLPDSTTVAGFPIGQNATLLSAIVSVASQAEDGPTTLQILVDGVLVSNVIVPIGASDASEAFLGGAVINAGSVIEIRTDVVNDASDIGMTLLFDTDV